jgi:hypothetical protein
MGRLIGSALVLSMMTMMTMIARRAAADDLAQRFPITDPNWQPAHIGLGQEPGAQAALNAPTILFVNFDGGTMNGGCGDDSHDNCSSIIQGDIQAYPGDDSARAAVVQAVREDTVDFGIITIDERPPDDMPYAMVMVGAPDFDVGQIGGIAPSIDCGNSNPNETSFSFLVTAGANTIATVINQEAAHTWGLEHVDDDLDNLYPTAGGTSDPTYRDVCSQVVSDTDLNPSGGQCNEIHTMFCDSGHQNSYRELLLVFGPTIPDGIAPTVSIDEPAAGTVFDYDDDWDLVITLADDRKPQILVTSIFFDDTEVLPDQQFLDTTLTFPVKGGDAPQGHGLSEGMHTLRVEIEDEGGNPASAEVTIEISGGPVAVDSSGDGSSGTPDDGTGDDGGTEDDGGTIGSTDPMADGDEVVTCSCDVDRPAAGALPLGLLLLARRRRRAA